MPHNMPRFTTQPATRPPPFGPPCEKEASWFALGNVNPFKKRNNPLALPPNKERSIERRALLLSERDVFCKGHSGIVVLFVVAHPDFGCPPGVST